MRMNWLKRLGAASCVTALTGMLATVSLADGASSRSIVNRYVRIHTVGGARVDLDRIDLPKVGKRIGDLEVVGEGERAQMMQAIGIGNAALKGLVAAGLDEAWVLVDAERMDQGIVVVLTLDPANATPEATEQILGTLQLLIPEPALNGMVIESRNDHLIIGYPKAIEPTGEVTHEIPASVAADRGQAITAFASPSPDHLRAIREMVTRLPPPFERFDIQSLTRNMQHATMDLMFEPKWGTRIVMQCENAEGSPKSAQLLNSLFEQVAELPDLKAEAPELSLLIKSRQWEAEGASVSYLLTEEHIDQQGLAAAFAERLNVMRGSATAAQEANNQKQLLLALHNYYDTYQEFPTNITDENGKPILSWRVRLLPYLEQQALFNAIKMDEPWDSEHNKQFNEIVIRNLQSPFVRELPPGMTVYVRPIADGTLFGPRGAKKFQEVVDGTSNTIALVVADPERAVNWMAPDDLVVDLQDPHAGLMWNDGTATIGILDGSVHRIPRSIEAETLRRLLQYRDGQPVDF